MAEHTEASRASQMRRWWVDTAVAAAVGLVQVGGTAAVISHRGNPIHLGAFALLTAGAVALVGRRRFPVAVLAVTYVTTLWYLALGDHGGPVWLSVIVAFGTAVYLHRRAAALAFLVAGYVGYLWGPAALGTGHGPSVVFALSLGAGLALLVGASEWIRLARQRSQAVAEGRREESLRRAGEERIRIARELHDVVAHSIAAINVQAGTALHLMDRQPERARLALTTINEVSRQALVELRSVLGVLRGVDPEPSRAPTSGLARLDDLLRTTRAAGLEVDIEEEGQRRILPLDLDLAVFRILQEALTNSARHSGAGRASIRIAYDPDQLLVEVVDDGAVGRPRSPACPDGTGSGILGMAERADALGGSLEAGPRPEGGFSVRARLPLNGHSA